MSPVSSPTSSSPVSSSSSSGPSPNPNHPPYVPSGFMSSGDPTNPVTTVSIAQYALASQQDLRNLCLIPGVFQYDVLFPSAPHPSPDFPPPNQYVTTAYSPESTKTPSPVLLAPSEAGNSSTQSLPPVQLPPTSNQIRVPFSDKQREILNTRFALKTCTTQKDRQEIAEETGLTREQVGSWIRRKHSDQSKKIAVEKQEKGVPAAPKSQVFSEEQRAILREHFSNNPNPSFPIPESIALKTGLTVVQVKRWFKGERANKKARCSPYYQEGRQRFSTDDLKILKDYFDQGSTNYEAIAAEIKTSHLRVKNWFHNKRKRQGNQKKKQRQEEEDDE